MAKRTVASSAPSDIFATKDGHLEWQDGLLASSFVTPAEIRRRVALSYERREIAFALFDVESFTDQVEVSDEQIAAYYADNESFFLTEESVDIEFVELDLPSIAASVEVSEGDLREYYETEVESFSVGEERQVSHILIEPDGDDYQAAEAEVEAIMARLEAGESFADLVAEVSDDIGTRNFGGDLGYMSRGEFSGPFEDVLFSMGVGDIEGPVETEFGYHILRLEDIRATEAQPFEAVRDQLREELAADQAYAEFYDLANQLANDAYDARDDLASVAEDYDLTLETLSGLTRSGNTDRFVDPTPVIAEAFRQDVLETGENSGLVELSDERVAILRVTAHNLPEPRPLESAVDEIREILIRDGAEALAAEAASAYTDALNAEPSDDQAAVAATADNAASDDAASEEVSSDDTASDDASSDDASTADEPEDLIARAERLAAEHGATWNPLQWIRRDSANVAANIIQLTFGQTRSTQGAPPRILRAALAGGDEAVVLFTRTEAGRAEDVPADLRDREQELMRQIAAANEVNAYAAQLRAEASVRVPDRVLDPNL